jgi:predicted transposase YbfD/YdcC
MARAVARSGIKWTLIRTARTVEKGHGRLEKRTITVSSMLADYITWPELAQVFQLESQRTNALGTTTEVRYGVTSLPAHLAAPKRLLDLTCGHWGIENRSHYVRDVSFQEDRSRLRSGNAPQILAALRNLAITLLHRSGTSQISSARRSSAHLPERALALLCSKGGQQ